MLSKEASRRSVFPFDKPERFPAGVTHDDIAAEITKERVLVGEKVTFRHVPPVAPPDECSQLVICLEDWLDVGLFFKFLFAGEQFLERRQFAETLVKVEMNL